MIAGYGIMPTQFFKSRDLHFLRNFRLSARLRRTCVSTKAELSAIRLEQNAAFAEGSDKGWLGSVFTIGKPSPLSFSIFSKRNGQTGQGPLSKGGSILL